MNKFILILSYLVLYSCANKPSDSQLKETYNLYENPENVFWEYTQEVSEAGFLKYTFWSGKVEIYTQKQMTLCYDSLTVTFFEKESNKIKNTINSKLGVWKKGNNNIKAIENVVVKSVDGKTLYTDTLYYNNIEDKIYSNSNILFISGNDSLRGASFISNTDLSNIKIFKVKATYNNKE